MISGHLTRTINIKTVVSVGSESKLARLEIRPFGQTSLTSCGFPMCLAFMHPKASDDWPRWGISIGSRNPWLQRQGSFLFPSLA
jgi:hypothetical protein